MVSHRKMIKFSNKKHNSVLKPMLTIREPIVVQLSAKTKLHLISSPSKNQLSPPSINFSNPNKINSISRTKAASTQRTLQPKFKSILPCSSPMASNNRYSK